MSVSQLILDHISTSDDDFPGTKSVTARLSLRSYSCLSALASELGVSTSSLFKSISEEAITEATNVYFESIKSGINTNCDDPRFFSEKINNTFERLVQDL